MGFPPVHGTQVSLETWVRPPNLGLGGMNTVLVDSVVAPWFLSWFESTATVMVACYNCLEFFRALFWCTRAVGHLGMSPQGACG